MESSGPAPVYLTKDFHCLLNGYDHKQLHGIDWHSDQVENKHLPEDPITSLSWGCAGVLLLRPVPKTGGDIHVVVAEHGDVLVMGGISKSIFNIQFLECLNGKTYWAGIVVNL